MRTLLWVVADGARRFRWLAAGTVASGIAGLLLQVAAFAIVLGYAHAVEKDRAVSLPGLTGAARELPALLWLAAGGAALCWLAASAAAYWAKALPLRIRRAYLEHCWARAVSLLWQLPLPGAPTANRLVAQGMQPAVIASGARVCSRLVAMVLNALLPLGRLAVALAALFWIHWPISLLLVVLALAGLVFQTRYSRAAGRASISSEARSAAARRRLRGLLSDDASLGPEPAAALRASDAALLWDAKIHRLELRERASLAMNALGAIALLVVLAVLGSAAIGGHLAWTRAVVYVAALQYFIANLGMLGALATTAGRFLPQATRYREFVTEVEAAARAEAVQPSLPGPLLLVGLGDGTEELRLAPGERCWIVAGGLGAREAACQLQLHASGSPRIALLTGSSKRLPEPGPRPGAAGGATGVVLNEPLWVQGGPIAQAGSAVLFLLGSGLPPVDAGAQEPVLVAAAEGGLRPLDVGFVRDHSAEVLASLRRVAVAGDLDEEDDEE